MKSNTSNKPNEVKSKESKKSVSHSLILFNDDINLYEFVVDSLIEVCKHNPQQAEQCTLIAHHNGKCDVKLGSLSVLKPMKDELVRRGLAAVITANK